MTPSRSNVTVSVRRLGSSAVTTPALPFFTKWPSADRRSLRFRLVTTHSPTQYSRSWATITGPSSRASALRSARARRLSALRVTLGPAIIGTVSPTDATAHHSVPIASYAAEAFGDLQRSEERRVGKGGVSQGRSRWLPDPEKK